MVITRAAPNRRSQASLLLGSRGGQRCRSSTLSRAASAFVWIYSSEPRWNARPPDPFEKIATHYLSEMRSIEPKGPYYLGGYCFGGTVAFEMAQQLRREGQEVALLVLLVPSTPLNCDHFPSTVRNGSGSAVDGEPCGIEIQYHFRNQGKLEPKERIVDILAKTKRQITGTALTLSAHSGRCSNR